MKYDCGHFISKKAWNIIISKNDFSFLVIVEYIINVWGYIAQSLNANLDSSYRLDSYNHLNIYSSYIELPNGSAQHF